MNIQNVRFAAQNEHLSNDSGVTVSGTHAVPGSGKTHTHTHRR